MEQLQENLRIFEQAEPMVMTKEGQELIHRIQEAYEAKKSIGCTGCKYCMPCPKGVGTPDISRCTTAISLQSRIP